MKDMLLLCSVYLDGCKELQPKDYSIAVLLFTLSVYYTETLYWDLSVNLISHQANWIQVRQHLLLERQMISALLFYTDIFGKYKCIFSFLFASTVYNEMPK